jgi:hypothetical protein
MPLPLFRVRAFTAEPFSAIRPRVTLTGWLDDERMLADAGEVILYPMASAESRAGQGDIGSNQTAALWNQSFTLEKLVRDILYVAMLAIERVV